MSVEQKIREAIYKCRQGLNAHIDKDVDQATQAILQIIESEREEAFNDAIENHTGMQRVVTYMPIQKGKFGTAGDVDIEED